MSNWLFLYYQHQKISFIHNDSGCPTAINLMILKVFILFFKSHKYRNDNIKYLRYLFFFSQFIYIYSGKMTIQCSQCSHLDLGEALRVLQTTDDATPEPFGPDL